MLLSSATLYQGKRKSIPLPYTLHYITFSQCTVQCICVSFVVWEGAFCVLFLVISPPPPPAQVVVFSHFVFVSFFRARGKNTPAIHTESHSYKYCSIEKSAEATAVVCASCGFSWWAKWRGVIVPRGSGGNAEAGGEFELCVVKEHYFKLHLPYTFSRCYCPVAALCKTCTAELLAPV